jgi:hypothetical protein
LLLTAKSHEGFGCNRMCTAAYDGMHNDNCKVRQKVMQQRQETDQQL